MIKLLPAKHMYIYIYYIYIYIYIYIYTHTYITYIIYTHIGSKGFWLDKQNMWINECQGKF